MSPNNSTLPGFRAVELNILALEILQDAAVGAASTALEYSLLSLLFGVLTILVLTAIYFLISGGSVAQINGKILLFSTLILYLSTTTYTAALIWAGLSGSHLVSEAANGLFSLSYNAQDEVTAHLRALHKQSWMLTIALGGNTLTGDAIVWWRASVIWQHKVVNYIGVLLLISTSVCGIVGMMKAQGIPGIAFLIVGNIYAETAAALSLCTNILATSLVAFKAWEHRRMMMRDFAGGWSTSRVFKALALLVESGCIYCAILIFVIVYQDKPIASDNITSPFTILAVQFTYGCFLPLVAIYPTIIIVLVALKRSPIDTTGLSNVRRRARDGHDSETADGRTSTIVFHHSTFRSSASVETEDATTEVSLAVEHPGRHSLEASMSEPGGTKVGENIA